MSSIEKINAPENPQFTHILSHATKVSGLIFLSGSTPQGKDGKVVEGGIKVVQLLFYRRRLCWTGTFPANEGAYCNVDVSAFC